MATNTIMNCDVNVVVEETLTVTQYSISAPHALMELGKNGDLRITVAGGGAELDKEQMLVWFKHAIHLLDKGFNDPTG